MEIAAAMRKRLVWLKRAKEPDLALWEMAHPGNSRAPALLLHGATYGAAIFDLERDGYSLTAALASAGINVWALECRGYGASGNTPVMNAAASSHPPYARAEDVVGDVAAAIAHIRQVTGAAAVDLIGFSWGSVVASLFAERFPEEIRRLALYAPLYAERNELWLQRIGDPDNRELLAPRYGSYRLITLQDTFDRWNDDLPPGAPERFRENGIPELLFGTQAELDAGSKQRQPYSFRCPNGALADLIRIFNGKPIYDPAKLTMPVLLIRGEHDTTSTLPDVRNILGSLRHSGGRYVEIAGGSHFLCVERNRHKLYRVLCDFLIG
jgi:pimeloyl-ACP methyl ester carboxylesterase